MKIYIATSVSTKPEIKESLLDLSKWLAKKGHQVDDKRVFASLKDDEYNDKDLKEYYKTMINSIKHCDVMIADISSKSSGLGYEIGIAANEKKPILAIYTGPRRTTSSLSLTSAQSKNFFISNYNSKEALQQEVEKFLDKAKDRIDTKFILIISPEIDKYLEWAATERRMHKAQIVRNSIEATMQEDKEYQDYLKRLGLAA